MYPLLAGILEKSKEFDAVVTCDNIALLFDQEVMSTLCTLSGYVEGCLSVSGVTSSSKSNVYEIGTFKLIGPSNFPSNVGIYDLTVADVVVYSKVKKIPTTVLQPKHQIAHKIAKIVNL